MDNTFNITPQFEAQSSGNNETGQAINTNECQVVRREFLVNTRELAMTFVDLKFYVNAACVKNFADVDYVQVLINSKDKILALRPCASYDKDAFQWCTLSNGRKKPRHTLSKMFSAKLFSLMNWDHQYKYRVLGQIMKANDEKLMVFDLKSAIIFERLTNGSRSRTPKYPIDWQKQFGVAESEHRQSLQIDLFDNYAIYYIDNSDDAVGNDKEDDTDGEIS